MRPPDDPGSSNAHANDQAAVLGNANASHEAHNEISDDLTH
ncbi:MAG: hypothetical protein ACLGID_00300 [Gammaproteobacteria bacterium]